MFDLIPLERHMNAHVGEMVRLKLWRTNKIVEAECRIGDLHAIVPHRFITRAGANFHQLSYQQALKEQNIPVEGVWVAGNPSTNAFRFEQILVSINNEPVTDLDRFDEIISQYDAGGFITTCHNDANDINTPIRTADYLPPRRSSTGTEWRREPREGGPWRPVEAPSKPSQPQPLPLTRLIVKPGTVAKEPKNGHDPGINAIFRSMAWLKGYSVASVEEDNPTIWSDNPTIWSDWGLIVNKEKGLIMARRGCATHLSQIILHLAGKLILTARVRFLHEADNFMLLEYNPADAHDIHDELRDVQLSDKALHQDDELYYVAFDKYDKIVIKTVVEVLSDWATMKTERVSFTPMSREVIKLGAKYAEEYPAGVLLDLEGHVLGLRNTFHEKGSDTLHTWLPANRIKPIISCWEQNTLEHVMYQDFDIDYLTTDQAVNRGVSTEWTSKVEAHHSAKRQMVQVKCVPSKCVQPYGSVVDHPLQCDDIILTLNGELAIESSDWTYIHDDGTIKLRIFRDGVENDVVVPTRAAKDLRVDSCVVFCGLTVHKPNLAILMNKHPCQSEIYMASVQLGSPAQLYRLRSGGFITAVNGKECLKMHEFEAAVVSIPDNEYFTLNVFYGNSPTNVTIKKHMKRYPDYKVAVDPNATDLHNPWVITILNEAVAAA